MNMYIYNQFSPNPVTCVLAFALAGNIETRHILPGYHSLNVTFYF